MARAATITTTSVPLRTRTAAPKARPALVSDNSSALEAELLQLTEEFYTANKEANAAKAKADKAKKALDRLMSQNEIDRVDTEVDGVAVEALYEGGTENVVDIQALRKLVGEQTFLEIVSASQKSVSDHLGDNVLNKVIKAVPKEPSLKIRAKK